MRFIVVNATGRTLHVRLDRNGAGQLVMTLSKKKIDSGRPIVEYVMAHMPRLHVPRMDGIGTLRLANPDGFVARLNADPNGDQQLHISLPSYSVN